MRVTNSMMINTFLRNLNTNMGKMDKSQEQLSSGRRINRPSDDPVGLTDALRLRTGLKELEQFKSNADQAKSWLETSDAALGEANEMLQRVRELTVRGANGSLADDDRRAISAEIRQIKEHLIQVGNTKYGDRYIFSGTFTRTPSFTDNGIFQGNEGIIEYEIGIGVKVPLNVAGFDDGGVMKSKAFGNIFSVIDDVVSHLDSGNIGAVSGTDLPALDLTINSVLENRADIGARVNRIDLSLNRISEQNVNMNDLLSKAEDVDIAELITHLKVQENVYKASLAAGAKIVQPTLIDFLR